MPFYALLLRSGAGPNPIAPFDPVCRSAPGRGDRPAGGVAARATRDHIGVGMISGEQRVVGRTAGRRLVGHLGKSEGALRVRTRQGYLLRHGRDEPADCIVRGGKPRDPGQRLWSIVIA